MAIGALGACMWHNGRVPILAALVRILTMRVTWLLALAAIAASFTFGMNYGLVDQQIYSAMFLILVMNTAIVGRGKIVFSFRILATAGRYSYAAYCFHWIVFVGTIALLARIETLIPMGSNHSLHYAIGFLLTFGIAAFSYRYFERPFLKLKARRFTMAKSEPDDVLSVNPAI
jgi:peptidoglycan/LPS O-acetylase OafA/YrhL